MTDKQTTRMKYIKGQTRVSVFTGDVETYVRGFALLEIYTRGTMFSESISVVWLVFFVFQGE